MKYLFFDKEEQPYTIESEDEMVSFIEDGSLKGKTLLYDFEKDRLDKASQYGEFSRLNSAAAKGPRVVETSSGQTTLTYDRTLTDKEQYIIRGKDVLSKSAPQKVKSAVGCVFSLIIIFVVGIPWILSIVDSNDEEVSSTTSSGPIINYDDETTDNKFVALLKSYEEEFNSDQTNLQASYDNQNTGVFLSDTVLSSKDSIDKYNQRTNMLIAYIQGLITKEEERYKLYKDSFDEFFASDSSYSASKEIIYKEINKGHEKIAAFYNLELDAMSDIQKIYKLLMSIPQKYHFESGQIVFDKTADLKKFNTMIFDFREKAAMEKEWMNKKEQSGLFDIQLIREKMLAEELSVKPNE